MQFKEEALDELIALNDEIDAFVMPLGDSTKEQDALAHITDLLESMKERIELVAEDLGAEVVEKPDQELVEEPDQWKRPSSIDL